MKPRFDPHSAGVLLLIVLLAWLSLEAIRSARQWRRRAGAARIGRRSFWFGFGACLIATNLALYLGPSAFPAAAIRPGAVTFTVGMVILVAGVVLRGWSFYTLGRYFTAVIKVSPDQLVVTNGPYRLLRHPSHAGGLLLRLAPQAPDPARLVTVRDSPDLDQPPDRARAGQRRTRGLRDGRDHD